MFLFIGNQVQSGQFKMFYIVAHINTKPPKKQREEIESYENHKPFPSPFQAFSFTIIS